jgi:hypothetical protein
MSSRAASGRLPLPDSSGHATASSGGRRFVAEERSGVDGGLKRESDHAADPAGAILDVGRQRKSGPVGVGHLLAVDGGRLLGRLVKLR